jgi:hypothetical protein
MQLADYYDIVKAFPSNRSDHALGAGVLPRRAWRDDRFPDVQRPGLTRKSFSIDLVSVPDQIPWSLLQPARLDQLPNGPPRGRIRISNGIFASPLPPSAARRSRLQQGVARQCAAWTGG